MQLPWLLLAALSQSPVAEPTDTPQLTIPAPEAQKNAIAQQTPKPKPKPKPVPAPCPPCGRG
jgi:hypothetical protein